MKDALNIGVIVTHGPGSRLPYTDKVNGRPEDCNENELAHCIALLAERGRDAEAANFRREKLRRQFLLALNARQAEDPYLANTRDVIVGNIGELKIAGT
jgi:hypothetical protein